MENKRFVIAINREAGAGGKAIAEALGKRLGVNVYSKAALNGLIEHFHLTEDEIEHIRARRQSWWDEVCQFHRQFAAATPDYIDREVTPKQLYHLEAKLIKELAANEPCIVVGRAAFHIFKDDPDARKVFIIADRQDRTARMASKLGLDEAEASKVIDEVDKQREAFTKTFAGVSRYDAHNYDLVCNVSHVEPAKIIDLLERAVRG